MFEGKHPCAGAALPLDLVEPGKGDLHPVSWSDLVARLDAVRELRASLGAGESDGDGSFDPDSARHIAAIAEGKADINFDDLANGKAPGDISPADTNGAARGEPRN